MSTQEKILVTGASGRTGSKIVKQLLEAKTDFIACVRSQTAKQALLSQGVKESQIAMVDLTADDAKAKLVTHLQGCSAMIVASGCVPKISVVGSLANVFGKVLTFRPSEALPVFNFTAGNSPREVEWLGGKTQVDAAKEAKCPKVVYISSMGGTKPDHFMNRAMDRVLDWKRKTEQYLVKSGVTYCIIHPPRLKDDDTNAGPGPVFDVDDKLLDAEGKGKSLARSVLAALAIAAAQSPAFNNRSFDCQQAVEGEPAVPTDWAAVMIKCLGKDKNCDYNINKQVEDW